MIFLSAARPRKPWSASSVRAAEASYCTFDHPHRFAAVQFLLAPLEPSLLSSPLTDGRAQRVFLPQHKPRTASSRLSHPQYRHHGGPPRRPTTPHHANLGPHGPQGGPTRCLTDLLKAAAPVSFRCRSCIAGNSCAWAD